MGNAEFEKALRREPQDVPPVWFMRQAGRYHRHYQAIRAGHGFMEMCKDPKLAAQVALGPIEDFDFDVAILFSDLLFPLEAMGMGLRYDPSPRLGWHLCEDTVSRLRAVSEALPELAFQKRALVETRRILPAHKSLIGFVGGPFTLFTYAVEGAHKGSLETTKRSLGFFSRFCDVLVPLLVENIKLQLEGGAEIVMIFDTAAGEVSPRVYADFVKPELEKLVHEFPKRVGYYAKGVTAAHLDHPLFHDPALLAGLGFDHRWSLAEALAGHQAGFVQGNFDQALLLLEPEDFRIQALRYLEDIRRLPVEKRAGWVSGLGHGVLPGTPEENVRTLVKLVREVMT